MKHGLNIKRSKAEVARENIKKAQQATRDMGKSCVLPCSGCGKECRVNNTAIKKGWKHCSWSCRVKNLVGSKGTNAGGGAWMRGEKNINYKHGKSSEREPRDLTLVNRWRRRVFERDGFRCQRCGYDKGKIFRAHHISPWVDFPDLRFDLGNGVTLCDPCHRWVHSKANAKKEFIKCS
jgi:hypothetical protein